MSTSSAVDTNISSLPAEDQARTTIETSGKTTSVTVTGKALSDLVVQTSTLAPNLKLDGSFKSCDFVGGAATPERFTVTGGNNLTKCNIVLGADSFSDVINFQGNSKAKGVVIEDFAKGDKLKYRGETYTSKDIQGKRFDGISIKEIKLA